MNKSLALNTVTISHTSNANYSSQLDRFPRLFSEGALGIY